MQKYDPIKVTWLDIVEDPSWQDDADVMSFPKTLTESLGYYIGEVEEDGMTVIIISSSVFIDETRQKSS